MPATDVATQQFMQMSDLLVSPPLAAFVSLLIIIGTLHVSFLGARWLRLDTSRPIEIAAAFVLATALLAGVLHALAWAGWASLPLLRGVGWLLIALVPFELKRWRFAAVGRLLREHYTPASRTESLALVICGVIGVALFAAVLGPATDADSLEYHLGVPLDWLRQGTAYARPDWFHARLAALGEGINMLGLAMGTDNLGAVFQAAGLAVATVAVTAFAKTRSDRIFGTLCVAACPVTITLTTAQKWQLFPAAGLTVALVLLAERWRSLDYKTALLVFGCASFAVGSKYSFVLSAGVVVLLALFVAYRSGKLFPAVLILAACALFIAGPVLARNFAFYGDPFSPMLERWKSDADPAVMAFARYLREYYDRRVPLQEKLLLLPWSLTMSFDPGKFQDVLGIGTLLFLLIRRRQASAHTAVVLAAVGAFTLTVCFSQLIPRFFFEPYLWCAAVAVAAPPSYVKSFFVRALMVQGVIVAGLTTYIGGILFSGAVSQSGRERVMISMAAGYAEAKWLDKVLPKNAVVLESFRYRALMPRPFVVGDRFLFHRWHGREERLAEFMREKNVTVLVTEYPFKQRVYQSFASRYGAVPLVAPAKFEAAARNAFNRESLGWIVMDVSRAILEAEHRQQPVEDGDQSVRIGFNELRASTGH